jgi:hypothetical protein
MWTERGECVTELPITAFYFSGENGEIKLTINEVFGFPSSTSYAGGYDARGMLSISACEYSVSEAEIYFATGELYEFYVALKSCYENLSGTIIFSNTEEDLEFKAVFNKLGHVVLTGKFQQRRDMENCLYFEIKSDQTQVKTSLSLLEDVIKSFGGMKGVTA